MLCYTGLGSLVMMMLCSWVLAENGMREDTTIMEPAEMPQFKRVTSLFCHRIFREKENAVAVCKNTFTRFTSEASKLQFKCRSRNKATFAVPPQDLQIIVIIPTNSSGIISSTILRNYTESGTVSRINNDYNYTVWTTTLEKDGTVSGWRRGPDIPRWDGIPTNYTVIGEPRFEYIGKERSYTANFTIGMTGIVNNKCFNIYNMCDKKQNATSENIEPKNNQTNTVVTIKGLLINDECKLSIWNNDFIEIMYENKYITPTPADTFFVKAVTNVKLDVEPTETGWDVQVKWDRPEKNPRRYKVTLMAPEVLRSVNVSGWGTTYTFKGVPCKEQSPFNITIYSIGQNNTVSKTVLGIIPRRSSYKAVIITGSWSVALTAAAVAIGLFIWWRRRKAMRITNITSGYFTPALKQIKECLMESSLESVAEDRWELRFDKITLHEIIGEGAFGVVRRGTLTPGVKEVAVKMLKDYPTPEEIRSFRAEMELMKSVGAHPHIVSLVGCCSGIRPLIVAEYCSRGDLLTFLRCSWDVMVSKRNAKYYNNNIEGNEYRNDLFKTQDDSNFPPLVVNKLYDLQSLCELELTPLDLLSFCRQIAMGMEFLALNKVVHRDLAARNILVTGDRTLKIADFGLSRDVYQENQYKQRGNGKMPVKWMALESLTHRIYTTMSDVWSFGVVVWEVVTVGGAPYPEVAASRLPRLLRAGYRMPKPNNCSKQLYELMMSCWQAKPRDRPTFAELHAALDDLLDRACADEYLSLELDYERPPTPKPQRYLKMLLRGNRVWARGQSYERPLKGFNSNHYTTPPESNTYPHSTWLKNSWLPLPGADYRADIK